MLTIDWNVILGQLVFNFIRHAAEGASAEILAGLRLEVETTLEEVQRREVQIQPAVLEMVNLALAQDLGLGAEVAPPQPPVSAPAVPEPTKPPTPNNYPRYYPQLAPAVAPRVGPKEIALPAQPTFIRPAHNGNSGVSWVGARNVYARYFSSQSQ